MRDIWQNTKQWLAAGHDVAIATVINTWGSAPRPVGSHMAIAASGEFAGSVSGGCVENAVIEAAQTVLVGAAPRRLRFGVSDAQAWGVGLACGGSIDIFVYKVAATTEVYRMLDASIEHKTTVVHATCIHGPETQVGRQLVLGADGQQSGSIDAGEIDAQCRRGFDPHNPVRSARLLTVGDAEIFIEPILPPPRLLIVGGVHIAIALARFAAELGFQVFLIDPRSTFANRTRFPHVEQIHTTWPDEALAQLGLDANTFVVVLSHDPKLDDPAVVAALQGRPAYIGVLGSRKTHEKRVARLTALDVSAADIARLHAPIGLPIGARLPEEIALSIAAEMVAVQRQLS